jgi:hypothetical protein
MRHLAGLGCAGDGHTVLAGAAFSAGPGDRVSVEYAAGRQPDQQVHGLPGQGAVSAAALYPASRMTSGAPRQAA